MTERSEQTAGKPCAGKLACTVWEGAVRNGQECTALAAYFTLIGRNDPRYVAIDGACFASKNLYNAALYEIRQTFIHQRVYLNYAAMDKRMQNHEAYKALPAKVAQQVLRLLEKNWISFFEVVATYKDDPLKFRAQPKLPTYKHKTAGRNLLVYTMQAVSRSKRTLQRRIIQPSGLDIRVKTQQNPDHIAQVRIVPKPGFYVVEVSAPRHADKDRPRRGQQPGKRCWLTHLTSEGNQWRKVA